MKEVPVSKGSVSLWCQNVELLDGQWQALQQLKITAGRKGLAKINQLRQSGQLMRSPSRNSSDDNLEIEQIKKLYQDERLGVREVAVRLGLSPWHIYRLMRRHHIPRRRGTEQNYATYKTKPQFSIKPNASPGAENLRVAGTMLYLAEGAKKRHIVDFANSDPKLIRLFLEFLRNSCGIAESRLRIYLYCYRDQNIERLKSFWSQVTKIPLSQFTKPYVREVNINRQHHKMRWGLVHVRYADKRLLELITTWGQELLDRLSVNGAGA